MKKAAPKKKEEVKKSVVKKASPVKSTKKAAVKNDVKKIAENKATENKTSVKEEKKEVKTAKAKTPPVESALLISGAKFLKSAFFSIIEKEDGFGKHFSQQKNTDKPTASSRPKMTGAADSKNLVELLSQQLEYENKTFFEGCEGQICVKCNVNNVDPKYYVDKSLGYCAECAALLGLGQSKEGVFSDAQMELMRRSMEKSIMHSGKDDDIESVLDDMDSLELEEALLAAEEDLDLN